MLYKDTVTEETMKMIHRLMKDENLKDFLLAGGTSLSLRLGHRMSDDIDLFSRVKFDQKALKNYFDTTYNADWSDPRSHGLTVTCGRENIDLWHYPVPLASKPETIDGVRMLSIEDVAAMKVNAIVVRPDRPKDFMDIYKVLEKIPLEKIINAYQEKYPDLPAIEHVKAILNMDEVKTRKLILFDKKITWEKIEQRMKKAILFPKKIHRQRPGQRPGLS